MEMRLKMSFWTVRPLVLIAAVAAVLATGSAHAAFVDPAFYGQANTTSQLWNGFTTPGGPNHPTSANNVNGAANAFDSTAATDGAFMAGKHIYSFSGVVHPEIGVPNFNKGDSYQTAVVLQVEVIGSPIDPSTFTLAAGSAGSTIAPNSVTAVDIGSSGSGFGGGDYVYTVNWLVAGNSASYTLNFTPNETSSSQIAYRVDTLASLSPVPEPTSIATISLGLIGLAGWRGLRRRRMAMRPDALTRSGV